MRVQRQTVANSGVICLLIVIAVGVYTAPRFNYSELVQRQAKVEQQCLDLHKQIVDLQATIDGTLASTSSSVDKLTQEYTNLRELLSLTSTKPQGVQEKTDASQAGKGGLEHNEGLSERLTKSEELLQEFQRRFTTAITLPPEAKEVSEQLPTPYQAIEWDFEAFVTQFKKTGLITYSTPSDIPVEVTQDLHRLFDMFQTNISLVQAQEQLLALKLANEANQSGDYIEVPIDAGSDEIQRQEKERDVRPGKSLVRMYNDLGVKRVYNFSFDEYPQWLEFQTSCQNIKEQLVYDVYQLAQTGQK